MTTDITAAVVREKLARSQGRMPVDRMMTFCPLAEINRAAEDSASGATIKPVLRMPS